MRNLAQKTKGRFYNVTNPKALPRIYQKEARTISRPLIFEQADPLATEGQLHERADHRPDRRRPADLGPGPDQPQGERAGRGPDHLPPPPTGARSTPLLAHWTYGLGRSVAFTSDAGRRWAKAWPDWETTPPSGRRSSAGRCARSTGAT